MVANPDMINYGIHLGITTSSIAKVDGDGTLLIPNKIDNRNYILNAVYIKKNGTIFVGDKAKNKILTDPKNGYAEFRLRMGSDHVYEFEKSGMKMTPQELSAIILQNLKESVYERYGIELKKAVITVPADFTALQVKATREAAELVHFEEVVLVQEPTAAAIAYEFDKVSNGEIWLVYDFGGTSFDVSVLQKDYDGINNINNQGDAYLGGKLIDWAIVDDIFIPAIVQETGLSDFDRNNPKYIKQFAKLKNAAELAKTEISTYGSAEIEIENLHIMENGELYDFEYDMEKDELDEVMKPFVDRTIKHCKKALEDIDLEIGDVTKIILVGGSTLSPYIHERLTEEFNIPLEFSIDPTTVVARGAAIFAGTKEKFNEINQRDSADFKIERQNDERESERGDIRYDNLENRFKEQMNRLEKIKEKYDDAANCLEIITGPEAYEHTEKIIINFELALDLIEKILDDINK